MSAKSVVSRLKLNGQTFEALCIPHKIREFREGKCKLEEALADPENIYKNSSRGERWAAKELEAAFGTSNVKEILKRIVEKGDAQITTEEKREDVEKKRKEVVHYLATKYVDPKTKRPHPSSRIESALDLIKGLTFDPKRDAGVQANEILKKVIDTGLPLVKSIELEATVLVAHSLQGPTQEVLRKMCTITATSHSADGAKFSIGLNHSDVDNLMKELAKATKGEFSFDLVEDQSQVAKSAPPVAAASAADGAGKKGKKGKN